MYYFYILAVEQLIHLLYTLKTRNFFLIRSNFCICAFRVHMSSNMPGWTLVMDKELLRWKSIIL